VYVIVVGAGDVGSYVARVLVEEAHEVVVVEPDEATAERLQRSLDGHVIAGSGVSPDVLRRAGIAQADLFLAVTPVDEINLVSCMIAKKQGSSRLRTVAKVKQSHYLAGASFTADDLEPVDELIHTEQAIAGIAMDMLHYAGSGSLREFADGRIVLVGMTLGSDSPLVNESLAELRATLPAESLVVAVHGRDGVRIPSGADRLTADERAYIVTLPEHLTELTILSGQPWQRVQRVLVIGLGNTGATLAQRLEAEGYTTTILEIDPDRAEAMAAHLPKSMVLAGDACDPDLLRRLIEDNDIDAVVVLLKDPERSLLIGLFASSLGAHKVVVRCDKAAYGHLANQLGVDGIISKHRAVANAVLRAVNRGRVISAVMLGEHEVEVIDFKIPAMPAHPEIVAKPLSELTFPDGCLIGGVIRDGKAFVASGTTVLRPGDEIVVVCRPLAIAKVASLLA
jgi:trk system potassium uptake protein TrkA